MSHGGSSSLEGELEQPPPASDDRNGALQDLPAQVHRVPRAKMEPQPKAVVPSAKENVNITNNNSPMLADANLGPKHEDSDSDTEPETDCEFCDTGRVR